MTISANDMDSRAAAGPVRRSELTVQELDGEALIYDPVTADTHRLNETAYFIWRGCDGRSTIANVAERLTEIYDVERAEATRHTRRMIAELIERGLVFTDPLLDD